MVGLKQRFANELTGEFSPEIVSETIDRFAKTAEPDSAKDEENAIDDVDADESDSLQQAVAPWALEEIRELCRIVQTVKTTGLTEEERSKAVETFKKYKGKKKRTEESFINETLNRKIERAVESNSASIKKAWAAATDIALFGRMATSGLMTKVDGAMAVAHAITTHAVEPQDIDWFTAVDDLVKEGAGHLNTQQFSAGVFYRYASVNIAQLQKNLGDVSRKNALEIAKHLFHMLATVVPTAKQQSFAAHNVSDFSIVGFGDQPISLANAFEEPVEANRNGGYLAPSIQRLADYWRRMDMAYDLKELAAVFDPDTQAIHDSLMTLHKLSDVENWIVADGKRT